MDNTSSSSLRMHPFSPRLTLETHLPIRTPISTTRCLCLFLFRDFGLHFPPCFQDHAVSPLLQQGLSFLRVLTPASLRLFLPGNLIRTRRSDDLVVEIVSCDQIRVIRLFGGRPALCRTVRSPCSGCRRGWRLKCYRRLLQGLRISSQGFGG
jgi:hypothetical protein